MAINNDHLAEILQAYGYGFVKVPSTDIQTLALLVKDPEGYLTSVGTLKDIFERKVLDYPDTEENITVPSRFQGLQDKSTNIDVGLKILAGYFPNPIGLEGVFGHADKISFSFDNVLMDRINLIQLDQFLKDAKVGIKAGYFKDKLEKGELYVITAVLKSSTFSIKALDGSNAKVDLTGPKVKNLIESHANFKHHSEDTGTLQYEGKEQLVFGIKAVRIHYDKPGWWNTKDGSFSIRMEEQVTMRSTEDFPVQTLSTAETEFFLEYAS